MEAVGRCDVAAFPMAIIAANAKCSSMRSISKAAEVRRCNLRYTTDRDPGFTRRRSGRGFIYMNPRTGRRLSSQKQEDRIQQLAIPPAWRDVWICAAADGHLQATGIDARGRKQYIYHARWSESSNGRKFDRLGAFGRALPAIRRRVERDLRQRGLPRDKVIACVVRLMDRTLLRVGNDEYARTNQSYGLTTIRNHHVSVNGDTIRLRFQGKSGRIVERSIDDPRIARIVRRCQDLPGQELFEYIDESGESRDVTSSDVNQYLGSASGDSFSAKDFRTWGGTVQAAQTIRILAAGSDKPPTATQAKAFEVQAVRAAAVLLGNTVATCRKFYVHPGLLDAQMRGLLESAFNRASAQRAPARLSAAERAVLRLAKHL